MTGDTDSVTVEQYMIGNFQGCNFVPKNGGTSFRIVRKFGGVDRAPKARESRHRRRRRGGEVWEGGSPSPLGVGSAEGTMPLLINAR